MKVVLSSIVMLAAACGSAPVFAQAPQTPAATTQATAPVDPDANKEICKRMEVKPKMPSAAIRTERICHTKAEWDELLKVNEEMMKRYKDAFREGSPPN